MALPNKRTATTASIDKLSILIYGEPKSGKSTFASRMGNDTDKKTLFFPTESGHKFLNIYKWTKENGSDPKDWNDFKTCLNEFYESKEYTTLVIDTVSILINWCENHILKQYGVSDESQGQYGNVFRSIRREFQNIINKLGQLNKGVVFVSHVNLKKEKEGYIYPDLPDKYENLFNGLVDFILYFHIDGHGKRLIRTKATPRIIAGDRSGKLPEIIPMSYFEFEKLYKNTIQENKK